MYPRSLSIVRVVTGVLVKDGKFLIARRPPGKTYAGYWEFPGGKVEDRESLPDALARELKEELGVAVLAVNPLSEHTVEDPASGVISAFRLTGYLVDKWKGEPQPLAATELRWVTAEELEGLPLIEHNRVFARQAKRRLGRKS